MLPLILSMSFCGTTVFVLYLLVRPFAQKYFDVRWRYWILKLSLLFYLVPFPKLKFFLLKRIVRLFPSVKNLLVPETINTDMQAHIFVAEDRIWIPWGIRIRWLLLLAIGILAVRLIWLHWFTYRRLKRSCLNGSFPAESENLGEIVTEASRKLGVRRNIPLAFSPFVDSPVTMGVLEPRIFLPVSMAAGMPRTELRYLITHELNHIKSQDVAVRFLALLATAVHWFNPFCHLLRRELREVSEYHCDACTLRGSKDPQRVEYSNLLLRLATDFSREETSAYAAPLVSRDSDFVERRIKEMKPKKEKKKVILSYVLGGLICVAGAMPVFAYAPPMMYHTAEKAEDLEEFVNSEITYYRDFDMDSYVIPMPYEYFWQGEDGTIIPLDEETPPESRAACDHDYQPGTSSKHTKYRDNSCKVVVRQCKICSLCGDKVEGSIVSTTNYPVCPH